jgi:dTDP-glucose 4,6-dehydratase
MPDNFWDGRRVTVTGAAGFIGSHLVEALVRAGAEVRAFVRYTSRDSRGWLDRADPDLVQSVEVFRGDLANPEAVIDGLRGADTVLHLGALIPIPYSFRHPREFVETNVVGGLNIFEACRRSPVRRIVHISSSEVYGTAQYVPIDEQHPLNAQSPYAATKVAADQLALSYQYAFDLPVVIARPFNTYGPRQTARAVIPTVIGQALSRETIELGVTSTTRDFLFVEDTCAGIMRCAQADGITGEVINLGTGVEVTIADLVERVQRLVGREVPVGQSEERMRPGASEVERLLADASKAERLLNWRATVHLDEGLQRTIDWMKQSIDSYRTTFFHV